MGGGTLYHRPLADRVRRRNRSIRSRARSSSPGTRPSAADTFAAFYQLEELRRVRDHDLSQHRRTGAADRADGLFGRTGASRSDPAQQPARHLYQFRQPARNVRPRGAGRDAGGRNAVRRHAARAGADDDSLLASIGRAFHADTGLPLGALGQPQPPLGDDHTGARAADEIPIAVVGAHLVRHAAQRRVACARRAADREPPQPRRTIGCSRLPEPSRRNPACCESKKARAPPSPSRSRRCLKVRSGDLSPPCRRRCRSARSNSPMGAASKAFWSRLKPSPARATFRASAAGALSWRRRQRRRDHDRSGGNLPAAAPVIAYAFSIKLAGSNAPDVLCVTLRSDL